MNAKSGAARAVFALLALIVSQLVLPAVAAEPDSNLAMQKNLTYTTPDSWTFGLNTESSYDWQSKQWSVPVNASVSKLTRFGGQLVSVGGGLRYWTDTPDTGAKGLGLRLTVTLLFPR